MPRSLAPSHLFVVRHGSRLDQADSSWALSSPTPYDAPLTYAGWVQSRNVGARIASLLHAEHVASADRSPNSPRKKRTRIVIHTSPFLRCVQTSISIASGIAQHHHQVATDAQWVDENGELVYRHFEDREVARFIKPVLRIDAWLGEWMTTDYYTDITPPPTSELMVGNAKIEYMRPSLGIPPASIISNPFELTATVPTSVTGGFVPPSPTYAVSSSGAIPRGFVSQAKDYVELDYKWDSNKLGKGAELGEEWSAMHKRFRNGYKRLISHYINGDPDASALTAQKKKQSSGSGFRQVARKENNAFSAPLSPDYEVKQKEKNLDGSHAPITKVCGNLTPPLSDSDEVEDEIDTDTVVIMVTHGAGCNALLGAISNQPVLIDIGISSLTMAVRSDLDDISRPRSLSPETAEESPTKYSLKLSANTEHTRTPLSSPPFSPVLDPGYRGPGSGVLGNFMLSGSGVSGNSLAAAVGKLNLQRSASMGSSVKPTGLWSMPVPADDRGSRESALSDASSTESDAVDNGTATAVPAVEPTTPHVFFATSGTGLHPPSVATPASATEPVLTGFDSDNSAKRLWTARRWDGPPPQRRWTVSRDAFGETGA
jgi:broad specificity phosphatase PhoE